MTPQEIEKAADNFKFVYSIVSEQAIARRGFISGANLVMERVRVLEEALGFYSQGNEWDYGLKARAALEGK